MPLAWILEQGGKYRDRVDKVRNEREERLDKQRKGNRAKLRKRAIEAFEVLQNMAEDNPTIPFAVLSPVVRPIALGVQAADIVATFAAEGTIEAGGAGAIDLFTPEIRRYEDTALVGLGGKII